MLTAILDWFTNTAYAEMMRYSLWGYPIGETVHLLGITLLFVSGGYLLRATWLGFGLIVLSGLSLFSAYAPDTIKSPIFVAKLALIAMAGVNMLFFTFRVSKGMHLWDRDVLPPLSARLSAGLSIVLWTLTIFAGRLIAYPEMFEAAA